MVSLFLLNGDLPWWADKSALPDMDMLMRKLIKENPGWVRAFLGDQPAWSPVWKRLRWQCKSATKKLIDGLLYTDRQDLLRQDLLRPEEGMVEGQVNRAPEALGGVSPAFRRRSAMLPGASEEQGRLREAPEGSGDRQGQELLRRDGDGFVQGGLAMADGEGMRESMPGKGLEPGGEAMAEGLPIAGSEEMAEGPSIAGGEAGNDELLRRARGAEGPGKEIIGMGTMRESEPTGETILPETRLYTLIRKFFKKKSQYGATYRVWAVNRLLKALFNGVSPDSLILLLRSTGWIGNMAFDGKGKREQVREELERLSTLQLTLLLYEINMHLARGEKGTPDRAISAEAASPEERALQEKQARVLALMERLGEQGRPLYELLLGWPDTAILSLQKKWDRQLRAQQKLDQMRERLLHVEPNDPEEADRQDIPAEKIGAFIVPALAMDGLTDVKGGLAGAVNRLTDADNGLTDAELNLLEDLLCKRPFDTPYKKRMAARLLRKLPDPLIRLLDHFTKLGPAEWAELLPPDLPITTIMESRQKVDTSERTLVENAGLCLFAPYLPSLFRNLDYLNNDRFKSRTHAYKAVYLLHYIWTGKRKAPEYLLAINKLFCGIPLEAPIPGKVRLGKRELEEADQLIRSVIDNWTALRSTSAEGLRGSFLCRKGMIKDLGSHLVLQVERKDYDILLNGISWGYSIIKLPWMKKYMQVEW